MKRIAAIFLCFALLMPVAVHGYGDAGAAEQRDQEQQEKKQNWKIDLLNSLGVLDAAEPAAVVTKQTLLNGLNQIFQNKEASAYLYFDGQILADPLLYVQAVMVLVDTLGYSHYVEMLGFDTEEPESYLKTARRIGLIDDAQAPKEQTISVDTYAELLYRALTEIPLMRPERYSGDEIRYDMDQDRTILSEYMKLEKINGVVTGVENFSNDVQDEKHWKKMKIDETWYNCEIVEDMFDYYGYRVEAYAQKNSGELRAIVISKNENRTLKLRSEDIASVASKNKLQYRQSNGNRTANIAKEADVIYNRALLRDYRAEDFKRKNSDYTLIDNNRDGVYEVVLIEQYTSFVVEQAAAEDEKVIATDGSIYDLSNYFKQGRSVYQADRTKTSLNKIAKNNVISYLCADDGTWTYIIVSTQRISGVLDESREDMRYIKIDGKEYECSAQYLDHRRNHETINVGDRVTAFFDINGFVIELRYVSSAVEAGYFMGAAEAGFDNLVFKVLAQDGKIKELNGSGSIVLNGGKVPARELLKNSALFAKDGSFVKQLILYRKNSEDLIVRMDTAKSENAIGGKGFDGFTLNYDSVKSGNLRALNLNGGRVLGSKYVATGESLMFAVSTEEDECYVQAGSSIPTNSGLNVKLYNVNDNYEPQYIVYEFSRKVGSWVDYYVDPIIVDYISQTIDQEGNAVYQLNGYSIDGKLKTAYIKDERIKTPNYNVMSGDNRLLDIELKDVPRGSIIICLENSMGLYAFALQHMPQKDCSEIIFEKSTKVTGNEYGINELMFNGQYLLSYGQVLQRTAAGIVVNNHLPTAEEAAAGATYPMAVWNRHLPLEPSDTILLYDRKNDKVYVDKASSILPGDYIFTKRNGTTYKGLFVYR